MQNPDLKLEPAEPIDPAREPSEQISPGGPVPVEPPILEFTLLDDPALD